MIRFAKTTTHHLPDYYRIIIVMVIIGMQIFNDSTTSVFLEYNITIYYPQTSIIQQQPPFTRLLHHPTENKYKYLSLFVD